MTVVEIIALRHVKSFHFLYFTRTAGTLGGPDIFEKLIKIAGCTFIVIGTGASFNAIGQAVTADPVHIRPEFHGRLPGHLFAIGRFLPHSAVVFAGGAVIVVIAILEFYHAGLHPEAGIRGFGFFIGLDQPDLAAHHGSDFLL